MYCYDEIHYLKILLLLVVYFFSSAVYSQPPQNIHFQNILDQKDISLGDGGALLQDSQGFMWLGGSNALIRFDGYEFRQFDVEENTSSIAEKVSIKFIQDLFEDSHKNLWIASQYGVYIYNPATEKVTQLKDDESQPLKITTSAFLRIRELPSGEIIACSFQGLFIIDPISLHYTTITHGKNKNQGPHSQRVNTAHIDKDNNLWLGTQAGLELVDWKSKTFQLITLDETNPELAANNRVADIIADTDHWLWLATSNGLVRYNTQTQERVHYQHNPNDPYSLAANDVWKLMIDSKNTLWIATDGGGISIYDKERNRFLNHQHKVGKLGTINSNQVRTIIEDRSGDIWTGNYPVGVNYFDRSTEAITTHTHDADDPNSLSHNAVLSIEQDPDGNLWLGTDGGGLNFFNRAKKTFTHFQHSPEKLDSINGNSVLDVYRDASGLIWTGTWGGGVAYYDSKTQTFTRLPFDMRRSTNKRTTRSRKLNSAHAWSIREDANHDLWISTFTGGLSKYDRKTQLFTHYTHVEDDPTSLSAHLAWLTLEDSRGNFWVGTNNGLNLMNKEEETFTHYLSDPKDPHSLSNPSVITLFEDNKGRLWAGTDAGLNLFNYETKKFTRFGKKDGFLDDTIRSIAQDDKGILWIGTNNGFSAFDAEKMTVKNYNRIGGTLMGGFKTGASLFSAKGELIMGGNDGLRIFQPSALRENKTPPPIAFTDLKIFADSVAIGATDGTLKESINHSNHITLDYKKSMFTLAFSALNFRDTEKNIYSFRLEGFDDDWLHAGNLRQAKYTNLDAGSYQFHVRASNNDGIWNEEGRSIQITVLPPPWKTWWAYAIYTTLVIGLLLLFVRNQRQKVQAARNISRELEHKVAERTAELQNKNAELESAYAQLEAISLSDPLTGLNNRRYLQKVIPMDIAKVQREQTPPPPSLQRRRSTHDLTFFILDVDFFKSVNDIHGHAAGDQLLIQLSALLTKICRESDCVVRWGGEEFLIVSRFADRDEASLMAERIRKSIEQYDFTLPNGDILKKTCSMGFASFPFLRDQITALSWEQVIDVADHALYAAKKSGRNRCVGIATNDYTREESLYLRISNDLPSMISSSELTVISSSENTLVWE